MNTPELQSALDETLRKIGRNILIFQKMEAILKYMVSNSSLEGTARNLKENHVKNIISVSQKTMGNLVKDLFASVYAEKRAMEPIAEEFNDAFIKISFKIDADSECIEQRKLALGRIVAERNLLIHQSLSSFDSTSIENCRTLSATLDEQAERVRPELDNLRLLANAIYEGRKDAFDALVKELNLTSNE